MAQVKYIELAKLRNHPLNPRNPAKALWDESMIASFASSGQLATAAVHKEPDGTYLTMQGNRRLAAVQECAKRNIVDHHTGKIFDSLRCEIYEGLTQEEQLTLILDHSMIRGLDKSELVQSVETGWNVYRSEAAILKDPALLATVQQFHPPIGKKPYAEQVHGTMQHLLNVFQLPTVMYGPAKVATIEGTWPTRKEVRECLKDFKDEAIADLTGKISRDNPGPKFMASWNAIVKAHTEAEANGTKAKATGMRSRTAVETDLTNSLSRTAKFFHNIQLSKISAEALVLLDKALAALEAGGALNDYVAVLDKLATMTE